MLEVPATLMAEKFAQYRRAAQSEPVAITDKAQITEVLVSKRDFDEFVRLKAMAGRSLWANELSPESIAALRETRVDPRHDHLDALMDE